MNHTINTDDEELAEKLIKVVQEHEWEKDPYPHYYSCSSDQSLVRHDSKDSGEYIVDSDGSLSGGNLIIAEAFRGCFNQYRLPKPEFDKRVEAAEEKARWGNGNRWTTCDNKTATLYEWDE